MAALWFLGALVIGSAFVAIVAALASGIPEAQHEDDLYLDRDDTHDDHMRVALDNTSATPIHDALAIETFRRQLDERMKDGLRDWGREDIA